MCAGGTGWRRTDVFAVAEVERSVVRKARWMESMMVVVVCWCDVGVEC
jgi:hypothetical protein